jgi:hypothetical protein
MMPLSPLGPRLTTSQPELILADVDHFLDLRTLPIEATDFRGRQGQAIGRVVLGAVSDDQDLEPTAQPASLGPRRMTPIGPEGLAIEPAVLFKTTDEIPAIVPNALQQGFRGIPRVKENVLGGTAQAIPGVAEEIKGQRIFGGPPLCHSRRPRGMRTRPSVQTRRTREKPYTGWPAWLEKTQARPSIAVAKGLGTTVSARMRYPRSQTNNVRTALSRSLCPDQSACSLLVKRSCDTVSRASARATQLPEAL